MRKYFVLYLLAFIVFLPIAIGILAIVMNWDQRSRQFLQSMYGSSDMFILGTKLEGETTFVRWPFEETDKIDAEQVFSEGLGSSEKVDAYLLSYLRGENRIGTSGINVECGRSLKPVERRGAREVLAESLDVPDGPIFYDRLLYLDLAEDEKAYRSTSFQYEKLSGEDLAAVLLLDTERVGILERIQEDVSTDSEVTIDEVSFCESNEEDILVATKLIGAEYPQRFYFLDQSGEIASHTSVPVPGYTRCLDALFITPDGTVVTRCYFADGLVGVISIAEIDKETGSWRSPLNCYYVRGVSPSDPQRSSSCSVPKSYSAIASDMISKWFAFFF